uniref:Uncharacterized protein n=1 Tax=Physcomitrium patens TaxID=3218 RepID=A0A7I4EPX1_PHYPA
MTSLLNELSNITSLTTFDIRNFLSLILLSNNFSNFTSLTILRIKEC